MPETPDHSVDEEVVDLHPGEHDRGAERERSSDERPGARQHPEECEAEPDVRIFYELYADEDALAEHEAQATTRYFLDRVGDYVTSTDVQRLHLVTATGIQGAAAATE